TPTSPAPRGNGRVHDNHQQTQAPNDDDDQEDESDVMPHTVHKAVTVRGRRASVSAESMTPSKTDPYIPVIIPKTDEQRHRISTSISKSILFRSCDEEQTRNVVDAMAEKKVSAGTALIQQGTEGDFFYVIESGNFDVFVNGKKVHAYEGEGSFGELALMYNSPRAATVTASTEATLWALDRVTFRRILMENTSKKRRMYEKFLEEVKLLASLEPYERIKIADALESEVFDDGCVVIQQGDVGEQFYIIEAGEATVSKVEDGAEKEFPSLKERRLFRRVNKLCFLELALLTDKPRQATVRAKGKLKVAKLRKGCICSAYSAPILKNIT
ncbi:cyclic nucleotide-binding-like protein, partial [Obelidium mucronatum]